VNPRRAAWRRQSDPAADRELGLNQFRVMSSRAKGALSRISPRQGAGFWSAEPMVTRPSDRRIGITVGNNRRWQELR
jgi:hypothetical protein